MYTFQAIATINTINDHGGFYAMAVICAVYAVVALASSDEVDEVRIHAIIIALVLAISAGISYNTGSITTYANKQVEATLVGFQAEGYNIPERSGKTTRQVDKHEQFVVYAVPEGNIMFPAAIGQTYPQKAVLYKN